MPPPPPAVPGARGGQRGREGRGSLRQGNRPRADPLIAPHPLAQGSAPALRLRAGRSGLARCQGRLVRAALTLQTTRGTKRSASDQASHSSPHFAQNTPGGPGGRPKHHPCRGGRRAGWAGGSAPSAASRPSGQRHPLAVALPVGLTRQATRHDHETADIRAPVLAQNRLLPRDRGEARRLQHPLHIARRMGEAAAFAQGERFLPRLDREGEHTARHERARAPGDDPLQRAEIDEDIGREDQVVARADLQRRQIGLFQPVVDPLGLRLSQHRRRDIAPLEPVDRRPESLARKPGPAAEVHGPRKAPPRQRLGQKPGRAVAQLVDQRRVETRCVLVEECLDESRRHRLGHRHLAGEVALQPRAQPVLGIGPQRPVPGRHRRRRIAQRLVPFAQPEPARRPVGRALHRLAQQFDRRAQIATRGEPFREIEAPVHDQVARGQSPRRHRSNFHMGNRPLAPTPHDGSGHGVRSLDKARAAARS